MLGEEGYQPRGRVVRVEDLDIYVVGSGDKCVVWNYDIFGFNSGRTKELADLLAESGFLVVMPDYFRGTFQVTNHTIPCHVPGVQYTFALCLPLVDFNQ